MKKIMRIKNKAMLLLMFSILLLCIGFIVIGCGTSPQLKIDDPNAGPHALDMTNCPNPSCIVAYNSGTAPLKKIGGIPIEPFEPGIPSVQDAPGMPITMEAWIKSKATATGTVLSRGGARGASLKLNFVAATTSTPSSFLPRFEIRRVVPSPSSSTGTSTVAYFVDGTTAIALNAWTHIAGILTTQDHSATHAACTVTTPDGDPRNDDWHIDIYQGGTYEECVSTYGGTTNNGDADGTSASNAYAHEPEGTTAAIGFLGVIDEARIWNTDREQFLSECMSVELGTSGNCNFNNSTILYSYFNAEEGSSVADRSGIMGSGTGEYPDPNNAGEFLHWHTGWTTDTPF